MPGKTAVLLLALAASLLLPAAAAFPLPATPAPHAPAATQGSLPLPTTPAVPPAPPILEAEAALDAAIAVDATLPLAAEGQATVSLQAESHANAPPPAHPDGFGDTGDMGAAAESLRAHVARAAAPAAGVALLALLAGGLAMAFDGLRPLQARIMGPLGRLGRLLGLLPAAALFSRIERGTLLDNPVRAKVHEAVAQDPGLSLSEVRSRTGIAWGTTVHHLRRLEAHGMVVSVNQSAHRRYFAANTPAASQRMAVAVIMQPTARRIARLVGQRPGIDQAGVCKALGLNNPAASKHLRQFEAQGLVESRRDGRSRHYHPTGALGSALLLVEPAPARLAERIPAMALPRATGAC